MANDVDIVLRIFIIRKKKYKPPLENPAECSICCFNRIKCFNETIDVQVSLQHTFCFGFLPSVFEINN